MQRTKSATCIELTREGGDRIPTSFSAICGAMRLARCGIMLSRILGTSITCSVSAEGNAPMISETNSSSTSCDTGTSRTCTTGCSASRNCGTGSPRHQALRKAEGGSSPQRLADRHSSSFTLNSVRCATCALCAVARRQVRERLPPPARVRTRQGKALCVRLRLG